MQTNLKKLRTQFAPRSRLKPGLVAPARGPTEAELEKLKQRLLHGHLQANPPLYSPLRHAANEAAALAWLTPFPLLVLPELLEEKVAAAKHHAVVQEAMLKRDQGTASAAA